MQKKFQLKKFIAETLLFAITITNLNFNTIKLNAAENQWEYSYSGNIQEFVAPYSGKYKLETWGAQGGSSAVSGALGGYGYVEIALLQGEKIYICVGEAGKNVGNGGYNGGGNSTQGGSGGGATSITTTNRGELKNYSNYKDEILLVSGGGAGSYKTVLPNQTTWWTNWDAPDVKIYSQVDAYSLPGSGGGPQGIGSTAVSKNANCDCLAPSLLPKGGTDSSGYAFGLGESGNSGAGGGFYGGYAGKKEYLSSGGGSGYSIETEFKSSLESEKNAGNGKAKITYEGNISRTITISLNGCGTYDGQTNNITLNYNVGDKVSLKDIDCNEGYVFLGYIDENSNSINKEFVMGKNNLNLKTSFYAPILIDKEKDGTNSIKINISQKDDFNKYYKVYQSKDGTTWYDAALSTDAKNGVPQRNMTFSPGSYTYIVPFTGDYKIRLYGAQGGNAASQWGTAIGGKGAYTEGTISLQKGTVVYINIGQQGSNGYQDAASASYSSGGKASDIRISQNIISQRIMVAGAGGGGSCYIGAVMNGTAGGALTSAGGTIKSWGSPCYSSPATGATQTSGGSYYYNSTPHGGSSGTVRGTQYGPAGSGGYGYWCGASGGCCDNVGNGTGGSSYISGYSGCVTFPGYVFSNTKMTAGLRSGSGYGYLDLLSDTNVYNSYMNDITFYDTKAPNIPSDEKISTNGNKIVISWKDNGDNGDKYYHKVESFNADTDEKINTSNILEDYLETGVKGFYYYVDTKSTGTVTASNSTFVDENKIELDKPNKTTYMHVAAVDNAGNISSTYSFEIPSVASYKVLHQQEQLDGTYTTVETENLSGTIGSSVTPAVKSYTGFTSPSTQTVTISADGSTTVTYKYVRTNYTVTYKDIVDNTSGSLLGQSTLSKKYGSSVRGTDIGSSTADNAYYNGYYYVSDTSATVGTSGATVYRIFKLRTINIVGTVNWIDNSNKWSTRPNDVTIYLYRDGSNVDNTKGLTNSDSNTYSFNNVPKYSTSDGHVYNYTVSQSEVISKTYPEDKYTTTQNTYNFINNLGNTDTDNNKGLTVKGSIYWEDKGDTLGYRPKTVTITLYQNNVEYKTLEVDSFNDNTYEFSKLPKYDSNLNKYSYTVKETVIANYLIDGEIKDAYTIKADTPNALDFTNVFNTTNSSPVPVKPDHENTVTVKTNTEDMITISLKGMETIINSDLSVSYGNNYNGQVYNLSANNIGTVLSKMNSGKYEINYFTTDYILNDITCNGDNNIWIEGSGEKYFLFIRDTNVDVSGTITLNFSKKDHIGYQTYVDASNYFKVRVDTASLLTLESEVYAISDMIIEAEDAYSIIYNNSDTIDENIYNTGDEVEVLDYEGELSENKEFLGWALSKDVEKPDYLVGDIINMETEDINLYPLFKDIEKKETSETDNNELPKETITSSENTEEKEIFSSTESEKKETSLDEDIPITKILDE